MNCPNCGASVEEDQQFCRSCGSALSEDIRRPMRPQYVIMLAFALTFLGIIVGISGDMAGLKWLKFTGVFMAIFGMFATASAGMLMGMRGNGHPQQKKAHRTPALERAGATSKLLPVGENDYVPSVVENTTELLVRVDRADEPLRRRAD